MGKKNREMTVREMVEFTLSHPDYVASAIAQDPKFVAANRDNFNKIAKLLNP